MAKKEKTTSVNFKKLDVDGTVLSTHEWQGCYRNITYVALSRSVKYIRTWVHPSYCHYTEDEVKKWCEMMNRIGFPIEYVGLLEGGSYTFVITVTNYTQKLHLTSALTIIRYLWEDLLDAIPKHFFKIMAEVEGINNWDALQLAHNYMTDYANTNHSLRDRRPRLFISRENIERLYKDFPIYNAEYPSISMSWQRGEYAGQLPASYSERYKILKENS